MTRSKQQARPLTASSCLLIMKRRSILLVGILTILFFSCEKKGSDLIWVYISETQCANEWDRFGLNSTEDNLVEYLKSHDIPIFDFNIEVYSAGPFCNACTCPSGRNIQVLIDADDSSKIEKLGFID